MKALILDVDWAPDFVIEDVVHILASHQVKATWFITHQSPALESTLRGSPLFELGIHPNFLPGSTHGDTRESVVDHCLSIVPNANCVRTHAYSQSSLLYKYVSEQTKLNIDASVFAPHTPDLHVIKYYVGNRYIYRVPVYWEDSNEMKIPGVNWKYTDLPTGGNGLQVFAFHPIHIYLNTASVGEYRRRMADIPDLSHALPDALLAKKQSDRKGVQNFFMDVVQALGAQQTSLTLTELVGKYRDQPAS